MENIPSFEEQKKNYLSHFDRGTRNLLYWAGKAGMITGGNVGFSMKSGNDNLLDYGLVALIIGSTTLISWTRCKSDEMRLPWTVGHGLGNAIYSTIGGAGGYFLNWMIN